MDAKICRQVTRQSLNVAIGAQKVYDLLDIQERDSSHRDGRNEFEVEFRSPGTVAQR